MNVDLTSMTDPDLKELLKFCNAELERRAISKIPSCPHQDIIKLYHELLPTLRKVKIWSDKRKKHLQARWRENPEHQSLEFWFRYFIYVESSDFLTGRSTDWQCNLEWLVNSSNFIKVIEGNYSNTKIR